MMGLENIEHLKPSELSCGMKKRVGLARAVTYPPHCILL
jgi:ABC-type transporter Mla maintaining outer membrane lipid asymmetry ATPase subunit MlaF